ncbi:MAG: hypothetical protein PHE15_01315 [Dehalococcoidales bacterium]|nr:hypothetical protein [Dehalococcoidales bacterium]
MTHFGSIGAIKSAPLDEISSIKGINYALAQKIKEYL